MVILGRDSIGNLYALISRQNCDLKDTYTPKFIAALFAIAKRWKQPKCQLTDEWLKKM